jgi:hypothetical protein
MPNYASLFSTILRGEPIDTQAPPANEDYSQQLQEFINDNWLNGAAPQITFGLNGFFNIIQIFGIAYRLGSFVTTIRSQGYEIQDAPWDGNCFFHVMAAQLNTLGEETAHELLRQHSIDYMQRHLENFQDFIDPNYIARMSQPGTAADDPIISATSRATRTNLNIHNPDGSITPISHEDNTRTTEVGYTGGHYVSLTPQEPTEELLPGHGCWYFGASS